MTRLTPDERAQLADLPPHLRWYGDGADPLLRIVARERHEVSMSGRKFSGVLLELDDGATVFKLDSWPLCAPFGELHAGQLRDLIQDTPSPREQQRGEVLP
jgi:hypothetical protein